MVLPPGPTVQPPRPGDAAMGRHSCGGRCGTPDRCFNLCEERPRAGGGICGRRSHQENVTHLRGGRLAAHCVLSERCGSAEGTRSRLCWWLPGGGPEGVGPVSTTEHVATRGASDTHDLLSDVWF